MVTLGEVVLIHDLKRQGLSVSAIAREHYVARLMDLLDAGFTAAKALRG